MAALPLFVAAGYFGARIVSDDGRRWRNLLLTREGHVFKGVCFSNGVFLASGTAGGPTIHSVISDGILWQNVYVPKAKNPGTGVKGNAFGNRHFIAFGGDGSPFGPDGNNNVVHSLDGLKWSEIIYPKNKRLLRRVAFGNGIFVGIGDLGRLGNSITGIDWKDAPQNVPVLKRIMDAAPCDTNHLSAGKMISRRGAAAQRRI